MIQIEPLRDLPDFEWSELATLEMQQNGLDLLSKTDRMWKVGEVAICGFVYYSFYQPPWMWFAMAKDVRFRDLIDFRRLAKDIPDRTLTAVRGDQRVARRFAEFYGFNPTEHEVGDYRIYRKEN